MRFKILLALSWVTFSALTMLLLAWAINPRPTKTDRTNIELPQKIIGTIGQAYDLTLNLSEPSRHNEAFISLDIGNSHAVTSTLQLPGNLENIYIDKNKQLAYLANSFSGLQIVDISDPTQPRLLSSLTDVGIAWSITVYDDILFLASAQDGLYLIDISSAETPTIISHLAFKNQSILKLAVSNQTLYAVTGGHGLLIIDITDLNTPRLVNTLYTDTGAWGVLTDKNRLYVSCGKHRLEVLNISNPAKPYKISELAIPDRVWSMRIYKNILYLSSYNDGLLLIDMSNPYAPEHLKSSIRLINPDSIDLHRDRAFISSRTGSMSILDLTLPKTPKLIGTFNLSARPRGIAVSDQTIYLASGINGLQTLNADNLVSAGQITNLKVDGNLVQALSDDAFFYLATNVRGLHIVERTSSGTPGKIVANLSLSGYFNKMVRIGDYLFLSCSLAGLQIVNISDPTAPTIVGNPEFSENTRDIVAIGNHLFLADFNQGLQVVDVASPENPILIGTFSLKTVRALAADSRYIYAATTKTGLHILDYSTPHKLKLVDNIPLPWPLIEFMSINRLTVSGTTVYMAGGAAGLVSFDTSNPKSPRLMEIINLDGDATTVTNTNNELIATTRQGKLWFLRKNSAGKTVRRNSIDTLGTGQNVSIDGNQVIIANGIKGLTLLPLPQQVDISNSSDRLTVHIPPQSTPGVYNLSLISDGKRTEFIGAVTLE